MTARRKKPVDPLHSRDDQIAKGIRPLWMLADRAMPILVSSHLRHTVDLTKVTHYCRERDLRWRPIAELRDEKGAATS